MTTRDWLHDAECRNHDPRLWDTPNPGQTTEVNKTAIAICGTCPVKAACLDYAMEVERGSGKYMRFGIYGGTTGLERHDIKRGTRTCGDCDQPVATPTGRFCADCKATRRREVHRRADEKRRRVA